MMMKKYKNLGKVIKTHGRKGEVILSTDHQIPDNVFQNAPIFIEIDGLLVPFFIEEFFRKSTGTVITKIEDINSAEEAKSLIRKDWFLSGEHFKINTRSEETAKNLEGFLLKDQNDQEIGSVKKMIEIPSNPLLQVKYKDHLIEIPFNKHTLFFIDEENKVIKNHIPDGLLELE